VEELQKLLEIFAIWTSTTGKVGGGDPNDPDLNQYIATLQYPRVCGVQDYRNEDNLVVQLPGLPFTDREVRALKAGQREAYEVIVPLDEHGLLVWMTARRPAVAVGRPTADVGDEAKETDDEENITQEDDSDDKTLLFVRFGTALLIPATVHYSAFHRSSMTGSPHLKAIITVKLKTSIVDAEPLIMPMPLLGNVAAGYAAPVGLKLPAYNHSFVPGKYKGELQKIFDLQHSVINGNYSCHLTTTFMLLFAAYCLPAKCVIPAPAYNEEGKESGKTGDGSDGKRGKGNATAGAGSGTNGNNNREGSKSPEGQGGTPASGMSEDATDTDNSNT
jgi:hypothetical protein